MFKEEREESQFEWSMLGDIEAGRPNLGPMVHVAVYRLMQFTLRDILIRDFGVEKTDRIFFEAGKKAGQEYCENILTEKKDLDGLFADLPHTNIALRMGGEAAGEELPEGYAKVIRPVDESGKRYLIHFTSVAPALQAQLGRLMKMSQGLS